jgi:hypothetical protein
MLHDDSFVRPRSDAVAKLLANMTLADKIGQMTQITTDYLFTNNKIDPQKLNEALGTYRVGSLLNSPFAGGPLDGKPGYTAQEWIELITIIQKAAQVAGKSTHNKNVRCDGLFLNPFFVPFFVPFFRHQSNSVRSRQRSWCQLCVWSDDVPSQHGTGCDIQYRSCTDRWSNHSKR